MLDKENYSEWIENYLDGEMTAEEVSHFEQSLQTNNELKVEFDFYKLAHQTVIDHQLYKVEDVIKEAQNEYIDNQKRRSLRNKVLIGGAVVVGGIGALLYFSDNSKDNIVSVQPSVVVATQQQLTTPQPSSAVTNEIEMNAVATADIAKDKEEPESAADREELPETKTLSTTDTIENEVSFESKVDVGGTPVEREDKKPVTIKVQAPMISEPCEGFAESVTVSAEATCLNKMDGTILIEGIDIDEVRAVLSSGLEAYDGEFDELSAGSYSVTLTNDEGCTKVIENVKVDSKACKVDLYFAPGESTVFPTSTLVGELTVLDKQGVVHLTRNIEAEEVFEWNGETNNGYLSEGYYLFIIKYTDGNIQQGSITITP